MFVKRQKGNTAKVIGKYYFSWFSFFCVIYFPRIIIIITISRNVYTQFILASACAVYVRAYEYTKTNSIDTATLIKIKEMVCQVTWWHRLWMVSRTILYCTTIVLVLIVIYKNNCKFRHFSMKKLKITETLLYTHSKSAH